MLEILEKIDNIFYDSDDIYKLKSTIQKVSYPKKGNKNTYGIEDKSYWYIHRNNCLKKIISKFSKNEMIFDIGGGNGFVSMGIRDTNNIPVIVEPDYNGILNAKKRGLNNLINSDFESLNIKKSSLPSIGLFDVLEHIKNDDLTIKNIFELLKENGKIYLTVPAYNFLWSNEDDDDGHYRRYSINKINNLLTKNGFTILQSTYFFSYLPIPIFFLRTIPSIFNKTKKSFEKESKDHQAGKMISLIKFFNNIEIKRISLEKKIRFGSSIIVVAKKDQRK